MQFIKTQNAPTTKKNKTNTSQKKANTTPPTTNDTNANTTKHISWKPKAHPYTENT